MTRSASECWWWCQHRNWPMGSPTPVTCMQWPVQAATWHQQETSRRRSVGWTRYWTSYKEQSQLIHLFKSVFCKNFIIYWNFSDILCLFFFFSEKYFIYFFFFFFMYLEKKSFFFLLFNVTFQSFFFFFFFIWEIFYWIFFFFFQEIKKKNLFVHVFF